MSKSYDDITATLRNNFKRIITLYEKKKEENRELSSLNTELKRKILLIEKENEELKNKQENTALASAIAQASGTNHDAKIQVNRIVREIDKCIALLNK
jgi:hypothetical protein